MEIKSKLPIIEIVSAQLADFREDEEAFWDTLDGETDAVDAIDKMLASSREDEAMEAAIKAQVEALRARASRISDRAKAKRRAIGAVLNAAGMRKIERPAATVSVAQGRLSVVIDDPESIPSQLMVEKVTRNPDKTAIKRQIEAGEEVPGCHLERGDDIITVRVV